MEFKKTALITGASRGIGAAIAKRLAKDGFNVLINCSSEKSLNEYGKVLQKICEEEGVRAEVFACDVSKYEECEEMFRFTKEKFGRVDCLINNAGITKDTLLARMEPEDFEAVSNVNFKGVFNTTKLASAIMARQKSGRIVNISSVVGLKGNVGQFNYCATKAGVIGMTKAAAKELGRRNVLVNAVAPGFITTEMTEKIDEGFKEKVKESIVLKRFGKAEEVAGVVSFLCSEDASYITGQIFVVDGLLLI